MTLKPPLNCWSGVKQNTVTFKKTLSSHTARLGMAGGESVQCNGLMERESIQCNASVLQCQTSWILTRCINTKVNLNWKKIYSFQLADYPSSPDKLWLSYIFSSSSSSPQATFIQTNSFPPSHSNFYANNITEASHISKYSPSSFP